MAFPPLRLLLALAAALSLRGLVHGADSSSVQFNRDIRPILAENCFYCHGPDPGTRKASLRLDREEGFFGQRDNGPVVLKGKPDDSPLYQRLIATDNDEVMPPPKSHHVLKPEQIASLRSWIAQGAPWQPHWSLVKPQRPELPEVKKAGWVRNPIDNFTLARLEQAGLQPAAEAERRALARRVSLDLTGLPPEPALVDQFAADTAPDAYEKLVDLLMSSPRYGEHRARPWLDAARYADTHGLHIDNYREIWAYRDWVINAFNTNMPFDRFTIEQLAGDLLPNPTESQLIATGFHRCNITTAEGGTIPEENLSNYARDRVETTSWVWLGLTANCAVCHDHKFDPISTKDFYSMSAFFRNTTQEHTDKNSRDPAPVLVMAQGADAQRWKAIPQELAGSAATIAGRRKELDPEMRAWAKTVEPGALAARMPGTVVSLPLDEGAGEEVHGFWAGAPQRLALGEEPAWQAGKTGRALKLSPENEPDLGNVAGFERDQPFSVSAWVFAPQPGKSTETIVARMDNASAYRGWTLEVTDRDVQFLLVSKWPDDAIQVSMPFKRNEWRHVAVTYDGSGKAEGVRMYTNGAEVKTKLERKLVKGSTVGQTALRVGRRSTTNDFTGAMQSVQILDRVAAPTEVRALMKASEARLAAAVAPEKRSRAESTALLDYFADTDPATAAASALAVRLEAEKKAIQDRNPITLIQQEKADSKPVAHILYRGQYDQPREEVGPAVFASLHPMPADAPPNRLGLAEWIVSPENPLTARVTVNRIWQEIFGTGIVKTAEDFGIMSEAPSHPELLDWLAVEFRESGWDMKHMVRLIVTSATYRQGALVTKEKLERDPQNRLLSRGPRFRMDAEMLRDTALSAAGLLSPKIGGPSVKPYQPEGVWEAVAMPGSNTSKYQRESGEALYRRSMYTFWKRTAPPPAMEMFNAPTRETSCLRRDRSNTPLQALVMLNDPQFVEASRVLAQHALKASEGDAAKALEQVSQRLLARSLRPAEIGIVEASRRDLLEFYTAHPEEAQALLAVGEGKADPSFAPAELAAWTMTCSQLLNLDEVLCK